MTQNYLKLPIQSIDDIKVDQPYLVTIYGDKGSVSFKIIKKHIDNVICEISGRYFNYDRQDIGPIYPLPTHVDELLKESLP